MIPSSSNNSVTNSSINWPNRKKIYLMYIGNTTRNYDSPFFGWIDYLEIFSIKKYDGSLTKIASSNINTWATATNGDSRFYLDNPNYSNEKVIDNDPDTFWISANSEIETIGIYFDYPQLIEGIGLKWPQKTITQ